MALQSVTFNGVSYSIPRAVNDTGWSGAFKVDGLLVALAQSALSLGGGTQTLTADLNFGASFGLVSLYFKSGTGSISSTGIFRLANTDTVSWRNAANNADLALGVNGSNLLTFGGTQVTPTLPLSAVSGGTGIANNVANTLTYSGNFGLTLTLTATTSVTLPTSGTLAVTPVTNANLATMVTKTIKGNATAGTAVPTDLTIPQLQALFTVPTRQTFASGTAATYTTPTNATWLRLRLVGGGGGGGGSGAGSGNGTTGNATTFSTLTANGGGGGTAGTGGGAGGVGGTGTGGNLANMTGNAAADGDSATATNPYGPNGAGSVFGGCGIGGTNGGGTGTAGATNTGAGGGGAGGNTAVQPGGGGGAGAYVEHIITAPSATYTYTVGATASGGGAGTSGGGGGAGAAGYIIVEEFYT